MTEKKKRDLSGKPLPAEVTPPLKEVLRKEVDSQDSEILDHVQPFLKMIGDLKLDPIDLTTPEAAQKSAAQLGLVLDRLDTFKRTARSLKTMLEAERDELTKETDS